MNNGSLSWNSLSKEEKWEKLEFITSIVDFTTLNPIDNRNTLLNMKSKIDVLKSLGLPSPYAICVYPYLVSQAKELFDLPIASVVSFPDGMDLPKQKELATKVLVDLGVDEIDFVAYLGNIQNEDLAEFLQDIDSVVSASSGKPVKLIFETSFWDNDPFLSFAAYASLEHGISFLKTNTGKHGQGATVHHATLFAHVVRNYYENTSIKKGVKVSGGIRTVAQAWELVSAITKVIPWATEPAFIRIGASKLIDNIIEVAKDLQG
ncbi:MAG: hypothetical protein GXO48_00115 [Chlorobi bacterium]|nr:hypothetical protein [Chlorobiota bacterium]